MFVVVFVVVVYSVVGLLTVYKNKQLTDLVPRQRHDLSCLEVTLTLAYDWLGGGGGGGSCPSPFNLQGEYLHFAPLVIGWASCLESSAQTHTTLGSENTECKLFTCWVGQIGLGWLDY